MKYFIVWADYDGCYIDVFDKKAELEQRYQELFNTSENGTHIKMVLLGSELMLVPKEVVTRFEVKDE